MQTPSTTHLLSLSLLQQRTSLLTPTRSIIDLYIGVTLRITVQGHPEDGETTVASLTDLRRSSSLESFAVFSLGGRRAAVAGLASGSGFSVIGVVGVELTAGFSSFTTGSVDGTGARAGAADSGAGSGASWLGVAVGGCSSCGGGLGSVVLGAGSGVSAGLGAGGGVDGLVAGLSSGSMATGGWITGAWMGASTG
jgi:hypothetical protein